MHRLKRAGALLLVLLLVGLVLLTLYFAVTGNSNFMASLIAMLMLPLLIYAYMFIYRLMKKENTPPGSKEESGDGK